MDRSFALSWVKYGTPWIVSDFTHFFKFDSSNLLVFKGYLFGKSYYYFSKFSQEYFAKMTPRETKRPEMICFLIFFP